MVYKPDFDNNEMDALFRLCGLGLSNGGAQNAGVLLSIQNKLAAAIEAARESSTNGAADPDTFDLDEAQHANA